METKGISKGAFDKMLGELYGLPDVASTRPATISDAVPMTGELVTFIVQTYRQRETGDTIFLQCVTEDGTVRVAIPPKVANAIARQRDGLTAKVRSRTAKSVAQARKDRGEVPGFLKRKVGE